MARTVLFEFFGEGQYLEFKIGGLRELEKVLGDMPISEIIVKLTSVSVLSAGLMVGLRHHYRNRPIGFFDDLIEKHLDNGGSLEDLWVPLGKAILVSGAFGKKIADEAEKAETDEDLANMSFVDENAGEPKNGGKAKSKS